MKKLKNLKNLLYIATIHGDSMFPTLEDSQSVVVSSIPYLFNDPSEGDMVIFFSERLKRYMIKRIKFEINGEYFIDGDYHLSADSNTLGYITKEDIEGKVITKIN